VRRTAQTYAQHRNAWGHFGGAIRGMNKTGIAQVRVMNNVGIGNKKSKNFKTEK